MTAAPQGPDLSFLNEEEARAIFQVLQRDAELRRAEKDRVRYDFWHIVKWEAVSSQARKWALLTSNAFV